MNNLITNSDNIKHLKHFINDHWRYSPKCKGTPHNIVLYDNRFFSIKTTIHGF